MNNDIWSIFVISIVGLIIFTGVGTINDFAFENNLLSDESNLLYLQYNAQWVGLDAEAQLMYDDLYDAENDINEGEAEPDVNTLDAFVKEYGEAKARIGVLRNSMRIITTLPNMLFVSIPFIDAEDAKFYSNILFLVIIVIVSIAIFKALFQRRVDSK